MDTICVIACDDARVPFLDELGRHHGGRAAGRSADGKPAAELVPDTAYYRRAIGRRDLALATMPPPAPSPEAAPPPEPSPAPVIESDTPDGAPAPEQEP